MLRLLEKIYDSKKSLMIFRLWEMITCTFIIIGVVINVISIIHHW
jgi:hypothetical protein